MLCKFLCFSSGDKLQLHFMSKICDKSVEKKKIIDLSIYMGMVKYDYVVKLDIFFLSQSPPAELDFDIHLKFLSHRYVVFCADTALPAYGLLLYISVFISCFGSYAYMSIISVVSSEIFIIEAPLSLPSLYLSISPSRHRQTER